MKNWPEILLIDKPAGMTSFDVIRQLRRAYGATHAGAKAPKMGHAGTLDPLATGLMIIGVGAGTKKLQDYIKLDKEYVAEVLLGERRTTGDMEGEVTDEKEVVEEVEILRSKISTILSEITGTLTLPVSAYSAIKKDGVPMYKRARAAEKKGEEVTEVPVREMKVYEAELLDVRGGDGRAVATNTNDTNKIKTSYHTINRMIGSGRVIVEVRFRVGSGTYIRSLGEELGRRLGYPACLYSLRRTKVGDFDIKNAQQIEDLK